MRPSRIPGRPGATTPSRTSFLGGPPGWKTRRDTENQPDGSSWGHPWKVRRDDAYQPDGSWGHPWKTRREENAPAL